MEIALKQVGGLNGADQNKSNLKLVNGIKCSAVCHEFNEISNCNTNTFSKF